MHRYHDDAFGGWDFTGSQFADISDIFGGDQPADGLPPARAFLKGITVRLKPDAFQYNDEARLQIVMRALAEALLIADDCVPPAWRVCALNGCAPLMYDMLPLPGCHVSSEAGWDLAAALRVQPQIAAADPAFDPA